MIRTRISHPRSSHSSHSSHFSHSSYTPYERPNGSYLSKYHEYTHLCSILSKGDLRELYNLMKDHGFSIPLSSLSHPFPVQPLQCLSGFSSHASIVSTAILHLFFQLTSNEWIHWVASKKIITLDLYSLTLSDYLSYYATDQEFDTWCTLLYQQEPSLWFWQQFAKRVKNKKNIVVSWMKNHNLFLDEQHIHSFFDRLDSEFLNSQPPSITDIVQYQDVCSKFANHPAMMAQRWKQRLESSFCMHNCRTLLLELCMPSSISISSLRLVGWETIQACENNHGYELKWMVERYGQDIIALWERWLDFYYPYYHGYCGSKRTPGTYGAYCPPSSLFSILLLGLLSANYFQEDVKTTAFYYFCQQCPERMTFLLQKCLDSNSPTSSSTSPSTSTDDLIHQLLTHWTIANDSFDDDLDDLCDSDSDSITTKNEKKQRVERQEKIWQAWFSNSQIITVSSIDHQWYPEIHNLYIHQLVRTNSDLSPIPQTRDDWFEITYYAVTCRKEKALMQMWELNRILCIECWNAWSVFNLYAAWTTQGQCWGEFDCLPMLVLSSPPAPIMHHTNNNPNKISKQENYEETTLSILQFFYHKIPTFAKFFDTIIDDPNQSPPTWLSKETKNMWHLIVKMTIHTI